MPIVNQREHIVTFSANAIAASGGTATFDVAIGTDTVAFLSAECLAIHFAAGHVSCASGSVTGCFVKNENGVLTFMSTTSGANPYVLSPTVTDGFAAAPTWIWSISGTNARLTATNPGAGAVMDTFVKVTMLQTASS